MQITVQIFYCNLSELFKIVVSLCYVIVVLKMMISINCADKSLSDVVDAVYWF